MERVKANEVSTYFIQHGLISKQHVFLPKRSTVTNLVETLNDWIPAVNNRQSVTVAYTDYKSAFDTVCHNKLLIKLGTYGITSGLLSWIKDFLFNRTQVNQVGAERSNDTGLASRIVQGSYLGTLLSWYM
jgi:Reverse transcriptase (RNA-dependent DNA polymerase)